MVRRRVDADETHEDLDGIHMPSSDGVHTPMESSDGIHTPSSPSPVDIETPSLPNYDDTPPPFSPYGTPKTPSLVGGDESPLFPPYDGIPPQRSPTPPTSPYLSNYEAIGTAANDESRPISSHSLASSDLPDYEDTPSPACGAGTSQRVQTPEWLAAFDPNAIPAGSSQSRDAPDEPYGWRPDLDWSPTTRTWFDDFFTNEYLQGRGELYQQLFYNAWHNQRYSYTEEHEEQWFRSHFEGEDFQPRLQRNGSRLRQVPLPLRHCRPRRRAGGRRNVSPDTDHRL